MGWTDERETTLKKLWLDGLSCSQIAKQLGGVTRNAVIGKIHRLGLNGRAEPSRPTLKAPRPPRPVTTKPVRAAAPQVSAAPQSAPVQTLGAHMCKWPIGDPASDGFTFCGRRSGEVGPYCREHAQVAYQQPQQKRRGPREQRHDTNHVNF